MRGDSNHMMEGVSSRNAGTHYVIHPKKSNSHQSSLSKLCLTVMRGEHNASGPTTDHDAADMPPPRRVPAPARAASPAARIMSMSLCPRDCTHRVAVPLVAAHVASPCPSRLHAHVTVLLVPAIHLPVRFPISYFY